MHENQLMEWNNIFFLLTGILGKEKCSCLPLVEVREGVYIKHSNSKALSFNLNESTPQVVKLHKSNIYKNVNVPLGITCNMRKQDKRSEILNKFLFYFIKDRIPYF